jgi:hypothetical protein
MLSSVPSTIESIDVARISYSFHRKKLELCDLEKHALYLFCAGLKNILV